MELAVIFVAAVSVIAAATVLGRKRKRRQESERGLETLARIRGWALERGAGRSSGFLIRGQTKEVSWNIVSETDSSSDEASASTTWSCDAFPIPNLELMIRTREAVNRRSQTAEAMASVLVEAFEVPGPQSFELQHSGWTIDSSNPSFDTDWVVKSRNKRFGERLLTSSLQMALTRWSNTQAIGSFARRSLSLDVGQTNLRAWCGAAFTSSAEVEALADVGAALLEAYQSAEQPENTA